MRTFKVISHFRLAVLTLEIISMSSESSSHGSDVDHEASSCDIEAQVFAILSQRQRGEFPEVKPYQQTSIDCANASGILNWMQKVDAVQIQSFIDTKYQEYRMSLPHDVAETYVVIRTR